MAGLLRQLRRRPFLRSVSLRMPAPRQGKGWPWSLLDSTSDSPPPLPSPPLPSPPLPSPPLPSPPPPLLSAPTAFPYSVTTTEDEDNLSFTEMVLRSAEKVYTGPCGIELYLPVYFNCFSSPPLLLSSFPSSQATHVVKDSLVTNDPRRLTLEEKRREADGILKHILPCNAVLHIAFPIHR